MPLLSVLTTIYNREKYLAECIESVLASDYADFEYILVDDGSTDGSVEIAQRYAKQDARIRFYQNEKNLGDYGNRNKAASYATGKYLKYVDSDDTLYPDALSKFVHTMEAFPVAGIGLVSHWDKIAAPEIVSPQEAYRRHFLRTGGFFTHSPLTSIIRKDVYEQIGRFHYHQTASDYDFWLRVSAYFPIVMLPTGLIGIYRVHEEQESSYDKEAHRLKLNFEVEQKALQAPDCPLSFTERKEALHRLKKYYAVHALLAFKARKLPEAWTIYRQHQLAPRHLAGAFSDRIRRL